MAGELRISMLIEANAARAKAEVAALRQETTGLGQAGREAAAGVAQADEGTAEWGSAVQMLRASIQPMVAEAYALAAAAQQLATYEEAGALTARESAIAHDQLARMTIDLQARMDALGVTIDGSTAAMVRHDTAVQQLIARSTGMSRAEGESIADHLRHGQALDDLRARFDPLFAVSRRYELELREIAEAERMGALSALGAAQARERAAQAMAPGIRQIGQSAQQANAHLANLGFQANDIFMMMAAGQNPMMLAIQQGTQVSQVFGDMRNAGMRIGPAIASAFTSLLNPVSLATMVVIGFGAAAVQWLGKTEEAADTAEKALRRLHDIESGMGQAREILQLSLGELIQKYGTYALAVREAAAAQQELLLAESRTALSEGIRNASDEWDRFAARMKASDALAQYRELERVISETDWAASGAGVAPSISFEAEKTVEIVRDLQRELGISEADAARLADAFATVRNAANFDDRLGALQNLNNVMRSVNVSAADLPPSIQRALSEASGLTLEMAKLKAGIDDNASALLALLANAPGGGWLAGAIGDAGTLAGTLWDAAKAAAAARNAGFQAGVDPKSGKLYSGRGGDPRRFGFGAGTTNTFDVENYEVPKEPKGGGGGGKSPVEQQREALANLRAEQERQIQMLRSTDPVQRIILENHEALAGAAGREKDEVVALILERERLEKVAETVDQLGQTGRQFFLSMTSGANSFSDALQNLLGRLNEMAASAVWDMFWEGPGGTGGLSSLVTSWLDGGSSGGTGPMGLPKPFAGGGRVRGPGGPTDDLIPALLSNEEYVVNAAATARNLPLLEAINNGASLSDLLAGLAGARPIALAEGGYLGALNGSSAPAAWIRASSVPAQEGGAGGGGQRERPMVQIINQSSEPIREAPGDGPDVEQTVRLIVGQQWTRGSYDTQNRARYGATPQVTRR